MSDCCSSNCASNEAKYPKKHACSSCRIEHAEVAYTTVLHHIKTPWQQHIKEQPYYFCETPTCDTVYFGLDDTVIKKSDVRTKIGIKEKDDDALLCYCFDVSRSDAKANPDAKTYVTEQTKNGVCSCTTHNPSGRCCLKDFPK